MSNNIPVFFRESDWASHLRGNNQDHRANITTPEFFSQNTQQFDSLFSNVFKAISSLLKVRNVEQFETSKKANSSNEKKDVNEGNQSNGPNEVNNKPNGANGKEKPNGANGKEKPNGTNGKEKPNGTNGTNNRPLSDYLDVSKGNVIIKPENGPATRVWGDPHVDFNNDGSTEFDFYENSKFVLNDGTEMILVTENGKGVWTPEDHKDGATWTGKVLAKRGDEYLSFSNVQSGGAVTKSEEKWDDPAYISNVFYESPEGWRLGSADGPLATTDNVKKNEGK